ncbi:polyprenyl synthetase family protein, partial [Streptomyces sp. NPDC058964]
MTALPSAVQAPPSAPRILERCRELTRPALMAAVQRLHPWVGEMAAYSFGWCEVGGAPPRGPGGQGVRPGPAGGGGAAAGAPGRDRGTPGG